jgi:SAM-dependent methyltransferase
MTFNRYSSQGNSLELAQHLADFGLMHNASKTAIERQLKKLMGPDRYRKYTKVHNARLAHDATIQDLYCLVQNAAEWGALFSSQTSHFLTNGKWVTDQLQAMNTSPRTLLDFGCSTGVLTSWLAKLFPATQVIGLEREENFLSIARETNVSPNLSFEKFDYGIPATHNRPPLPFPKAQAGISTFGIDFDFGIGIGIGIGIGKNNSTSCDGATGNVHATGSPPSSHFEAANRAPILTRREAPQDGDDTEIDPTGSTANEDPQENELLGERFTNDEEYLHYRHQATTPFRHWRATIEDGGTLLTVLRIPSLPALVGVVHGAHEAAWSLQLVESCRLRVGEELFPALRFVAEKSPAPPLTDLRDYWHQADVSAALSNPLSGYPAEQLYKSLHPKTIANRRKVLLESGTTLTVETGTVHAFSFAYLSNPQGGASLKLDARLNLNTVGEVLLSYYELWYGDYRQR